jgi:hypothetical protein
MSNFRHRRGCHRSRFSRRICSAARFADYNGEFNSHREGGSTQVVIEAYLQRQGTIRKLRILGSGRAKKRSFAAIPHYPIVTFRITTIRRKFILELNGGKVQVQNCTFDALSKHRRGSSRRPKYLAAT